MKGRKVLKEPQVKAIIKNLLEAVAYLHKNNIIHRDIKPANILVNNTDTLNDIHLTDFGLSLYTHASRNSAEVCGSPGYIAPEMFKKSYNEKID